MNVASDEQFGADLLAAFAQVVKAISGFAVRPFRRRMDEPNDRVEQIENLAIDGRADAMRNIAPVRKALHLFTPIFDALLQRFGRTPFVEHAADADFRGVPANAPHNAGNLSRRNRGKDDDFERIPRHAVRFNHPCDNRRSYHAVLGRYRGPATYRRPRRYNFDVSKAKVKQVPSADFPTRWGQFRIHGFTNGNANGAKIEEAVALVMGDDLSGSPLVRIHSQCLTGDVFGSLRCDCRQQLEIALSMIAREGRGVLVYEQQEGRGIGLMAKLQAYALQDSGLDTVEANERLGFRADHREFLMPVEILKALDIRRVRLLSNNPDKVAGPGNPGGQVKRGGPLEGRPP